ncbi:MAG: hypothetical protein ACI9DF_001830 [Verrucomicrobiales bacterium]
MNILQQTVPTELPEPDRRLVEECWSLMGEAVTSWGEFPHIVATPRIGKESLRNLRVAFPAPEERCDICGGSLQLATLEKVVCVQCEIKLGIEAPVENRGEISRERSVAVALLTVVSGCALILVVLLAWGGRSEVDAALVPVSAPSRWLGAWSTFEGDDDAEWHSLPVRVQLARTAFKQLPLSWEREGKSGQLIWVYHEHVSEGCLARFVSEDGRRLMKLLSKGGALKLTVRGRRWKAWDGRLMEIGRVEKLGWGRGDHEFEVGHRMASPELDFGAVPWLGGQPGDVAEVSQRSREED